MSLFTIEHGKIAYGVDFALYGGVVAGLAVLLFIGAPAYERLELAALALAGLVGWTLIEYLLHRFVLHHVPPFSRWHAEHHARPTALICAPTVLTGALVALLVFLPALLLADLLHACALTFGLLAGYQAYAITHHAIHHWHHGGAWLRERKRWHAQHHHAAQSGRYGVTSGFWDHVFRRARRPR